MIHVCGVRPLDATRNDFQRYFKCKDKHENECNKKGLRFPVECSEPPCNQCNLGNVITQRILHPVINIE